MWCCGQMATVAKLLHVCIWNKGSSDLLAAAAADGYDFVHLGSGT